MPDVLSTVLSIGGKVLIAAVIILVTWLVAMGVRKGMAALVSRVKFLQKTGGDGQSLGESVGKIAALLVWLFGLIAVLQVFSLSQVISPIQTLLQNIFAFLPNLIGAVFVFVVGVLLAKVARQLIETALRALPFDKWLGRAGEASKFATDGSLPGTGAAAHAGQAPPQAQGQPGQPQQGHPGQPPQGQAPQGHAPQGQAPQGHAPQGQPGQESTAAKVARLVGAVVYALIIIVVAIAALQILGIAAISEPASQMLGMVFDTLPRIIAALLLLGLGVMIAKFVGDLVGELLEGLGTDRALNSANVLPDGASASTIVTRVVQVAIVLFFAVMAAQALEFPQVTQILQQVLTLGGQVLFGAVIIAAGFFLGGLIERLMGRRTATTLIKWVTIVLFAAMGLKAMGIADSIIELGFGAVVVGGALAAALAFGLGGRETAARTLQKLEHKAEEISEEEATVDAGPGGTTTGGNAGSTPPPAGSYDDGTTPNQ